MLNTHGEPYRVLYEFVRRAASHPTRASILAWAESTPTGPPRNTPSPAGSAMLTHSSSDDSSDRKSITRSVGRMSISSISHNNQSSSRFESGTISADEDGAENTPFAEENSGNVADVESASSVNDNLSPLGSSPSTSPPVRPPIRPFSVPALANQPHTSVTSSESPPPALVVSHTHDQQVRLDRRETRHPQYSNRRRHRDRERRLRSSNPTPPTGPTNPTYHTNTAGVTATNAHYTHAHPQPQLGRLRLISDVPLPPPPPPLGPFRPLHLAATTGGVDVLEEIARMLHSTRRPLVRTGADSDGYGVRPRKENDVLDDICFMLQRR